MQPIYPQMVHEDQSWLPDHHLLAAVLMRTIVDLQMTIDYSTQDVKRDIKEAICWVNSKNLEEFSYLWICKELEIGATLSEEIRILARRASNRILYNAKDCEDYL